MSARDTDLAQLADADRADPDPRGASAVHRRAVLLAWRAEGRLVAAADQCAAAAVLVRGDTTEEVEAAQQLALAALASERPARALAAMAFDRLRRLAGRPQKFGTEIVVEAGRRRLWPVDPTTTDSERAKWDVPALADLRRRCGEAGST